MLEKSEIGSGLSNLVPSSAFFRKKSREGEGERKDDWDRRRGGEERTEGLRTPMINARLKVTRRRTFVWRQNQNGGL